MCCSCQEPVELAKYVQIRPQQKLVMFSKHASTMTVTVRNVGKRNLTHLRLEVMSDTLTASVIPRSLPTIKADERRNFAVTLTRVRDDGARYYPLRLILRSPDLPVSARLDLNLSMEMRRIEVGLVTPAPRDGPRTLRYLLIGVLFFLGWMLWCWSRSGKGTYLPRIHMAWRRNGFLFVLVVFSVSRLSLGLTSWVAQEHVLPLLPEHQFPWKVHEGKPGVLDAGIVWDATWYLDIALNGYSSNPVKGKNGRLLQRNYNFFPLYPMLIHAVFRPLAGEENPSRVLYHGGLLLSNLCALLGFYLLYCYCRERFGESVARNCIILGAFFPGNYVFSALYPEALFFLLFVAVFFLIQRGHWILAGVAGALLTATRLNGIMILLPAVLLFVRGRGSWKPIPTRSDVRPLLGLTLMPLGLLSFMAYLTSHVGSPFAFLDAADAWGQVRAFHLPKLLVHLMVGESYQVFLAVYTITSLFIIQSLLARRMYILYAASMAMVAPSLISGVKTVPFECFPRYVLVVFPVFIILALVLEKHPTAFALTLAFLALMGGALTVLWTTGIPLAF